MFLTLPPLFATFSFLYVKVISYGRKFFSYPREIDGLSTQSQVALLQTSGLLQKKKPQFVQVK